MGKTKITRIERNQVINNVTILEKMDEFNIELRWHGNGSKKYKNQLYYQIQDKILANEDKKKTTNFMLTSNGLRV